jgi:hypothetical protein
VLSDAHSMWMWILGRESTTPYIVLHIYSKPGPTLVRLVRQLCTYSVGRFWGKVITALPRVTGYRACFRPREGVVQQLDDSLLSSNMCHVSAWASGFK